MDPDQWIEVMAGSGIGGSNLFFECPAAVTFQHRSGRLQSIEQPIDIAQMTPGIESMPSLMGWDLLRYFRLLLDHDAGVVRLTQRRVL